VLHRNTAEPESEPTRVATGYERLLGGFSYRAVGPCARWYRSHHAWRLGGPIRSPSLAAAWCTSPNLPSIRRRPFSRRSRLAPGPPSFHSPLTRDTTADRGRTFGARQPTAPPRVTTTFGKFLFSCDADASSSGLGPCRARTFLATKLPRSLPTGSRHHRTGAERASSAHLGCRARYQGDPAVRGACVRRLEGLQRRGPIRVIPGLRPSPPARTHIWSRRGRALRNDAPVPASDLLHSALDMEEKPSLLYRPICTMLLAPSDYRRVATFCWNYEPRTCWSPVLTGRPSGITAPDRKKAGLCVWPRRRSSSATYLLTATWSHQVRSSMFCNRESPTHQPSSRPGGECVGSSRLTPRSQATGPGSPHWRYIRRTNDRGLLKPSRLRTAVVGFNQNATRSKAHRAIEAPIPE